MYTSSKIYQDNGIVVFDEAWNDAEITQWFNTFQYKAYASVYKVKHFAMCEEWQLSKTDTREMTTVQ